MAPYVRRTRKVLELATGPRAKKAVDLALKHSKTEITAIELRNDVRYGKYLRQKGALAKPRNLDVKSNTDAEAFLKKQKPNNFDHIFAHFLFQHFPTAKRKSTFEQAWRTLRPGGTLFALGEDVYAKQQFLELQRIGFKVSIKPLTRSVVEKMDTDHGKINLHSEKMIDRLVEASMREDPTGELTKEVFLRANKMSLDRHLRQLGEKPTPAEYKKLLRDGRLAPNQTRFFAIYAKKPSVRYVGPEGAHTTRQ